jgi:hypothetical protein
MAKFNPMKVFDETGKEMTFSKFLKEMGGSGVIYERDIEKLLKQWKQADWAEVDDYIAPLVAQVLVDAAEMDRELYTKLMADIVEAYDKLKKELSLRPPLTRIK